MKQESRIFQRLAALQTSRIEDPVRTPFASGRTVLISTVGGGSWLARIALSLGAGSAAGRTAGHTTAMRFNGVPSVGAIFIR